MLPYILISRIFWQRGDVLLLNAIIHTPIGVHSTHFGIFESQFAILVSLSFTIWAASVILMPPGFLEAIVERFQVGFNEGLVLIITRTMLGRV